MRKNVVEPGIP